MTEYSRTNSFAIRNLLAVNMDWPPPPPSPFDEVVRNKKRTEVRRHVLRLLKGKFPGLPY
ncbi:MAG: hypothetical protein WBF88_13480 [Pusillimonas sp.]